MCCRLGNTFLALVAVGLVAAAMLSLADHHESAPAGIPAGYRLVFETDFEHEGAINSWVFSDPAAWKIAESDANHYLEHDKQSDYAPAHRSPLNIALLAEIELADFVLEADLLQTGRDYGHRDLCTFFGFQDPAHFYYSHIATAADDHAHNIFLVNGAPRHKIATSTTAGYDWGREEWRRVRLVRDSKAGAIAVYIGDMTTPIQTASATHLDWGRIGFGSFDDTGRIDNIKVYAPSVKEGRPWFFAGK